MEDRNTPNIFDEDRINRAVQAGIYAALWQHKMSGNPVCVWRNDQVVWIDPEDIP